MSNPKPKLLETIANVGRLKSLFVYEPNWDEMEQLDEPCPRCKRDTLYREGGRLVVVDRCRECNFEGATTP